MQQLCIHNADCDSGEVEHIKQFLMQCIRCKSKKGKCEDEDSSRWI